MKEGSTEWARAVLAECERILSVPQPKFYDEKFPEQKAYILDDSPRVDVLCTRRAGKSYGIGLKLYRAAFAVPECTCTYLGLTRKTSKKIMWKDVMKAINRQMGLGCKFNESELSITTPTGSIIYLEGADSGKDEMDKVLGGKLKLVVIDEAGSFRIDLNKLCYEMIEPALADYDGTLSLAGTPTDLLDSLFHKVTTNREGGWSHHEWDTLDNPHMRDVWEKRIQFLRDNNPGIEETPSFRRMYKKEWVTDLSALVYKFDAKRNLAPFLPSGKPSYVLGIDLGFDDPTAFVVCAFYPHDTTLYVVETYKSSKMIISDVAERIRYYEKKYDIYRMVVDNASKQSVEELKQRYGLSLIAAEKRGKAEFIEIMNSELIMGKIKALDVEETAPLREEWGSLIWDERSDKREEHPACDNHLCFTAGTKISTPYGRVNIEDLRPGNLVSTRFGPREVNYCMASEASVIELSLSDGRKIWTTKDHPFLVGNAWVSAQNLLGKELTREKPIYSMAGSIIGALRRSISKLSRHICIETCGRFTMELSQRVITFTTKMGIEPTTALGTLNAYHQANTGKSTEKRERKELDLRRILSFSRELDLSQRNGMDLKREEPGTVLTQRRPSRKEGWSKPRVHIVEKNIRSHTRRKRKRDAVPQSALQRRGEMMVLMTSLKNVLNVAKNSLRTSMQRRYVAPLVVQGITDIGRKTVYNLNVDDVHEYFAEGVCVSNCDAALYSWRECYQYLSVAKVTDTRTIDEKMDDFEDELAEKMEAELNQPFWERDWG